MPPQQRIVLLTGLVESERAILAHPRLGPAAAEIIREAERELATLVAAGRVEPSSIAPGPRPAG